jgi:outer membrane protein
MFALLMSTSFVATAGQDAPQNRPLGDLGAGVYSMQSIVRGHDNAPAALPYAFFSYGRFFARQDTLGVKTFPAAYGYVEMVARINFDGFNTDAPELRGMKTRVQSLPLGVGTFQRTPVGGVFLHAFHDVNESGGKLLEAIYAAKFALRRVVVYPLLGAEYRDANYLRYYYGVSKSESDASGITVYQPDGALNPMLALQLEIPIADRVYLNLYWRRKWLDHAITSSPIVEKATKDDGFAAISYRFE